MACLRDVCQATIQLGLVLTFFYLKATRGLESPNAMATLETSWLLPLLLLCLMNCFRLGGKPYRDLDTKLLHMLLLSSSSFFVISFFDGVLLNVSLNYILLLALLN